MKILKHKRFANGIVYLAETDDGYPVEFTDTFLPFYTKDAINRNTNCLQKNELGSRNERWMIGVSVMSGCPVGCKFCATGKLKRWRNLTAEEILWQIQYVLESNPDWYPQETKEFKINYTRMGEPFLNIDAVRSTIESDSLPRFTHHYVSTIGIQGSDFSWIKDNMTLQFSIHALSDARRDELIPWRHKMTLEEIGRVRTKSKLKTTLNLTLVDENDFDINVLKQYFDPAHFFIKLSPINPNSIALGNGIEYGPIVGHNLR